jgi:cytidyltransferase-like protein
MEKKVFVSGCFDLLHSGHVAFLERASAYGALYVFLGSDQTIYDLKGRYPVINEEERRYIVQALKYVKDCQISSGSGILDFEQELRAMQPDVFVVNEDGNLPQKKELCAALGIEYIILKRTPNSGLPTRSTTSLRPYNTIPFRIDLCGGWLDQPFVSQWASGPVVTISIEPTIEFNLRSGMATSSRNKAIELWNSQLPSGDPIKQAKILFAYENPPGKKEIAGSQDHLGILLPGLNRLDYAGDYWPSSITSVDDETVLQFIEDHLFLIPLEPRVSDYDVLSNKQIEVENVTRLAVAASQTWDAILAKDLVGFGAGFLASFEAQIALFPNMINDKIRSIIAQYESQALGYKISGAGGGGYLILVANQPVANSFQIKIRRKDAL